MTLYIRFKRIFGSIKGKERKELTIATTEKWDDIADVAERNFQRLNDECLRLSKEFVTDVIPHISYDPSWEIAVTDPRFYRIVNTPFQPHAVSGSLSDGARMNIGGSQNGPFRIKELGQIAQKRGALYVSSHWETAVWETYGQDADFGYAVKQIKNHSNKKLHEFVLAHENEIQLIDFDRAFSALKASFRLDYFFAITGDMNGSWPDLKAPAPIQLFAAWLMSQSSNARGIRFSSTVDPKRGDNYALYFIDDREAAIFFKSQTYTIP